jgi:anti-sigma regulatory factor (Ser/Thr protein kinase)
MEIPLVSATDPGEVRAGRAGDEGAGTMAMQAAEAGGVTLSIAPPARCTLSVRVEHTDGRLAGVRRTTRWFLLGQNVSESCVRDVVLALHEAVVNALSYGEGRVEVEIEVRAGRVVATVRDHGGGFDPSLLVAPCPGMDERGRGLYLVSHLMDEVEVTGGPRPALRMVRTT